MPVVKKAPTFIREHFRNTESWGEEVRKDIRKEKCIELKEIHADSKGPLRAHTSTLRPNYWRSGKEGSILKVLWAKEVEFIKWNENQIEFMFLFGPARRYRAIFWNSERKEMQLKCDPIESVSRGWQQMREQGLLADYL